LKLGIVGKKVGMTQVYEGSVLVPVTVIDTSGCALTQLKTKETDGYSAIQLGFGEIKPQNVNKARSGHFKKAKVAALRKTQELRLGSDEELNGLAPGQKVVLSKVFSAGDIVDVTSTSKGKGFSGVMKRHNMSGTKATHGVHEVYRHGGSIGQATDPGRVLKNVRMPGQHGNAKVTVQNLRVVEVIDKENLLLIKGAVPGAKNNTVLVRAAAKKAAPTDRAMA